MTQARLLEFRFCYFTPNYDETVGFYRDGLGLKVHRSWDRAPDDMGTIFLAPGGAGMIGLGGSFWIVVKRWDLDNMFEVLGNLRFSWKVKPGGGRSGSEGSEWSCNSRRKIG